jgi:hypothetical protein
MSTSKAASATTRATSTTNVDEKRPAIRLYTGASVAAIDEVMTTPQVPAGVFDERVDGRRLLAGGSAIDVVFRDDRPDGFSLVNMRLAPDYILPTHHHDVDCLYYVQSGWIMFGRKRINAGGGFMVSAERPYTYRAGPEGATVLEFRQATKFNIVITETSPSKWREIVAVAVQHDGWPGFVESAALPTQQDD